MYSLLHIFVIIWVSMHVDTTHMYENQKTYDIKSLLITFLPFCFHQYYMNIGQIQINSEVSLS